MADGGRSAHAGMVHRRKAVESRAIQQLYELPDGGFDLVSKLLFQVRWLLPHNVVVLSRIEVHILQIVPAAAPDNRQLQGHGKACLEVHAWSLHGYVGDNKPRAANLDNNPVAYFSLWCTSSTRRG